MPPECMPVMKYVKRLYGVDLTTVTKANKQTLPAVVEKCVKEIEQRGEVQARLPPSSSSYNFVSSSLSRDACGGLCDGPPLRGADDVVCCVHIRDHCFSFLLPGENGGGHVDLAGGIFSVMTVI